MRLLGLAGWSGSGKTTLLTALLPIFRARGWRVSTVKHVHHAFDLDQPGKDSWRHRAAGAQEVLIAGAQRWALMHEIAGPEPELAALLTRLAPTDLVLIEGFRSSPHPKIEVHRAAHGGVPIWPDRPDIVAVATDVAESDAVRHCDRPLLPIGDPAAVADWAWQFLETYAALHTTT